MRKVYTFFNECGVKAYTFRDERGALAVRNRSRLRPVSLRSLCPENGAAVWRERYRGAVCSLPRSRAFLAAVPFFPLRNVARGVSDAVSARAQCEPMKPRYGKKLFGGCGKRSAVPPFSSGLCR